MSGFEWPGPDAGTAEPLAIRLRAEATEWDDGEAIPSLLIEAAEAIELLSAEVGRLRVMAKDLDRIYSTVSRQRDQLRTALEERE